MAKKNLTAAEFDEAFESGDDISDLIDVQSAIKRVNIDFPLEMLKEIDAEATRLGVARQAIVKIWLDERLDKVRELSRARAG